MIIAVIWSSSYFFKYVYVSQVSIIPHSDLTHDSGVETVVLISCQHIPTSTPLSITILNIYIYLSIFFFTHMYPSLSNWLSMTPYGKLQYISSLKKRLCYLSRLDQGHQDKLELHYESKKANSAFLCSVVVSLKSALSERLYKDVQTTL